MMPDAQHRAVLSHIYALCTPSSYIDAYWTALSCTDAWCTALSQLDTNSRARASFNACCTACTKLDAWAYLAKSQLDARAYLAKAWCRQRTHIWISRAQGVVWITMHMPRLYRMAAVDGVRGDLCHSSRMEAFCANSNIRFALHPTRSSVVVLEWS